MEQGVEKVGPVNWTMTMLQDDLKEVPICTSVAAVEWFTWFAWFTEDTCW